MACTRTTTGDTRRSAKLDELADLKQSRGLAQKLLVKLGEKIAIALGVHAISEPKARPRLLESLQKSNMVCESLEKIVESLADEIQAIVNKTTDLESSLLTVIVKREEISRHEKEEERIRQDHSASEKKAVSMEKFGDRIERIRLALLDTKDKFASDRLKQARPRSLELYQRLVRHQRFLCFDITTTAKAKKVDYNFEVSIDGTDPTAREARLVLSDGQITATAVSVFIGLAESAAHGLDLLFIDDPTQNLDLACKEAVAKLMVEMAGRKQIILKS